MLKKNVKNSLDRKHGEIFRRMNIKNQYGLRLWKTAYNGTLNKEQSFDNANNKPEGEPERGMPRTFFMIKVMENTIITYMELKINIGDRDISIII